MSKIRILQTLLIASLLYNIAPLLQPYIHKTQISIKREIKKETKWIPVPDTGKYAIWYSTIFREGYKSQVYTCPGGKRTSGIGNTHSPKKTTFKNACLKLDDTMKYYYKVVSSKYPWLEENQKWAVVSIAINCQWRSIFGEKSIFHQALINMEVPPFEKFCYDAKGVRRNNLLQSRLYEKALFTMSNSFIWINPYREYQDEVTNLLDLQAWYKEHYHDRTK